MVARTRATGEARLLRGDIGSARLAAAERTYTDFARLDQLTGTGDLDGDGNGDLVGRNRNGALRLFPGKGNGGFAAPVTLVRDWSRYDLTFGAGDLDGDGKQDLMARDGADLFWFPGSGRATLGDPRPVAGRWDRYDLLSARGDVTGDGRADLVARAASSGLLYVLPGDGTGALAPRLGGFSGFAGARWLGVAGQLAGSRHPDLGVLGKGGTLRVERHTGRTNLAEPRDTGIALGSIDLLLNVGDWDDDGHGDFMTRRTSGAMMLYRGRGRDTFAAPVKAADGWGEVELVAPLGDVTGDKSPDLVGQFRGKLRVYPGDGRTGLRRSVVSSDAVQADRVVGVDTWGGDRLADVVLRRADGSLEVTSLLGTNRHDGSRVGSRADRYDWVLGLGDVDGRGRSDVVARQRSSGDLWLLRGTRDGFTSRWRLGSGFDRYDLGG